MIPQQEEQAKPHTSQEIGVMVDRQMQWVDQFNQNLILTVQALQNLHSAFERRFVR